ncbi:MAG TPA: hypothetical protein P5230_03445, partial [Candidatus Magasanikbacteria bacterium]|nr:hypothetical protein [Candidatus Magasanikbacteria bacterium]
MRNFWRKNVILGLPIFLVFAMSFFATANAAFNPEINYQGKLFDLNNRPVSDGDYMMKFELFNQETGGTAVWSEERTSTPYLVNLRNGLFSVMLGDVSSLTGVDFNQTLYLEVSIGTSSLETMSPRKILGAVPAAFTSSQLEGKTWAAPGAIGTETATTAQFTYITSTNQYIGGFLSVVGNSTFGLITSGTWQGDIISSAYGGVGANSSDWTGIVKVSGGVWSTSTIDLSSTSEVSGILLTSLGGTGTSTLGSNGSLVYSNGSAYDFIVPSSDGMILQLNSGSPTWVATDTLGIVGGGSLPSGSIGQTLYYDGADWTATNNIFVSSSGFVGIGTTAPNSLLTLSVTTNYTNALDIRGYNGESIVTLSQGANRAGNISVKNTNSTKIYLNSNGSSYFNGGNVGIGTTTPGSLLQVGAGNALPNSIASFFANTNTYSQINNQNLSSGGNASTDYIATANNGTDTSYYVDLGINSSGYNNPLFTIVGANDSYLYASNKSLAIGIAENNSSNAIKFHTGGTLASNERMRIDNNGNVGIGTTNPTTLLSVAGTSTMQNILPDMTGGDGNVSLYSLGASDARWNEVWTNIINLGTSTWSLTQIEDRFSIFDSASGGGNERLSILANGNVGIGTSTDNNSRVVIADDSYTSETFSPPTDLQYEWVCSEDYYRMLPPGFVERNIRIYSYKDILGTRYYSQNYLGLPSNITTTTDPAEQGCLIDWSWTASADTVDGYLLNIGGNFDGDGMVWDNYGTTTANSVSELAEFMAGSINDDGPPDVSNNRIMDYGIDSLRFVYDTNNFSSFKVLNNGNLKLSVNQSPTGTITLSEQGTSLLGNVGIGMDLNSLARLSILDNSYSVYSSSTSFQNITVNNTQNIELTGWEDASAFLGGMIPPGTGRNVRIYSYKDTANGRIYSDPTYYVIPPDTTSTPDTDYMAVWSWDEVEGADGYLYNGYVQGMGWFLYSFTTNTVFSEFNSLPEFRTFGTPSNLDFVEWVSGGGNGFPSGTQRNARVYSYREVGGEIVYSDPVYYLPFGQTTTTPSDDTLISWSWNNVDDEDGYLINIYTDREGWSYYAITAENITTFNEATDGGSLQMDGPPLVMPTSTLVEILNETPESFGSDSLRLVYDDNNFVSFKIRNNGLLNINTNGNTQGGISVSELGNVGIGTSTPGSLLTVDGSSLFTGNAVFNNQIQTGYGLTIADALPGDITNALYNQGGELFWNGNQLSDISSGGSLWDPMLYNDTFQETNVGQSWQQNFSYYDQWEDVVMSKDGKYQTIANQNGYIFRSTDFGQTWNYTWQGYLANSVAMSADGKYQIAMNNGGNLYTSSNYGLNWSNIHSFGGPGYVAISADGKYQTLVLQNVVVYISSDFGSTWNVKLNDTWRNWSDVSISSDGKYQTASVNGEYLYTSSDYGQTWTAKTDYGYLNWKSLAMSSDGKYQTAAVDSGYIYSSTDYGQTWTVNTNVSSLVDITMSSDGKHRTAITSNYIYISNNFGDNWTTDYVSYNTLKSVAMSADAKYQTMVSREWGDRGYIYTSTADSYTYGKIGIGTASPSSLLTVAGDLDINNNGTLKFGGIGGTANQVLMINPVTSLPYWTNTSSLGISGASLPSGMTGQTLFYGSSGWEATRRITINNTTNSISMLNAFSNTAGNWSFAAGMQNRASGDYSFVGGGDSNITSGESSFIGGGFSNEASGLRSAIIGGYDNEAFGRDSIILGGWYNTTTNYFTAIIGGQANIASGMGATIVGGYGSIASGVNSVILGGQDNLVSGDYSIVLGGVNNTSTGISSYAMGSGMGVFGDSSFGINLSTTTAQTLSQNNTFAILGGNVGIGDNAPGRLLSVQGSSLFDNQLLSNQEGGIYFGRTRVSENMWNSDMETIWNVTSSKAFDAFWRDLAISSDGKYQSLAKGNDYIYISSDYGNTWVISTSSDQRSWVGISISSNGKYQTAVAGDGDGDVYISSDYGATWSDKTTDNSGNWSSVSISADGKYQTAVAMNGFVHTSSDYGNTWKRNNTIYAGTNPAVGISSDGKYQTVIYSGYIYISSNYGNTFVQKFSSYYGEFRSVALSSDGKYQTVVSGNHWNADANYIYISSDYGNTWTTSTSAGARKWQDVAISANGKYQTAISISNGYDADQGSIYFSSDYGNTWVNKNFINNTWRSIVVSAEGNFQAVISNYSPIYTSYVDISYGGNVNISGNYFINGSPIIPSGISGQMLVNQGGASWQATSALFVASNGVSVRDQLIFDQGGGLYFGKNKISENNWAIDVGSVWSDYHIKADSQKINWASISISSDGKYQIAGNSSNNLLYSSSDYGYSWTTTTPGWGYTKTAMSSDGKYQTITGLGNQIRVSSDYGKTWSIGRGAFAGCHSSISMSSDGKYQLATCNGSIVRSFNYGISGSWSESNAFGSTDSAVSSDGKYQILAEMDGPIRVSSDYGITWTTSTSAGENAWSAVSISANGKYQTAVVGSATDWDYIYISSDYGNTWSAKGKSTRWSDVAMSSDGKYQSAVELQSGYIFSSIDHGNTWATNTATGIKNWTSIAISSDGQFQSATALNDYIYISGSNLYNFNKIGIGTKAQNEKLSVKGSILQSAEKIKFLGTFSPSAKVTDIKVSGNYAYASIFDDSPFYDGVHRIDISSITNPRTVSIFLESGVTKVDVKNNHVHVLDENGFYITDFSDFSPALYNSLGSLSSNFNQPMDLVVSGKYAYITGLNGDDLSIVDISDPRKPIVKSIYQTGASAGYINGVYVSGRYAYLTSFNTSTGFQIVDISNPVAPVYKSSVTSTNLKPIEVQVSGNYAYILSSFDENKLQIIDISRVDQPTTTGILSLPGNPYDIKVSGKYAYVTVVNGVPGLYVIDISSPENPVLADSYLLDSALGVDVSGNNIFVGTVTTGLKIFEFSKTEVTSLLAQTAEIGDLKIINDLNVSGNGDFRGLNIGFDGLFSKGSISAFSTTTANYFGGSVGIGTSTPLAKLSLDGDGAILAQGSFGSGWDGGALGAGTRLMWIPGKAAFRAGYSGGTEWNSSTIGNYSAVVGGAFNTASGSYSFVGGGSSLYALANYSAVVGGTDNVANTQGSFIGGGQSNNTWGVNSFIAGGFNNTAGGIESFVGGGNNNYAQGNYSFVGGGSGKTVSGISSVAFGTNLTVSGNYSFGINVSTTASTISQANTIALMGGNVGVGTTSPDYKLNIFGTAGQNLFKVATSGNQGIFTINSSGNVGVGTTSPNYPLTVIGDINISGAYRINGTAITSSQWGTSGSNIYYNSGSVGIGTSTPSSMLTILGNGSTDLFSVGTSTSRELLAVTASGSVKFMNGMLVVDTTALNTARLAGSALGTSVLIEAGLGQDDFFYPLLPEGTSWNGGDLILNPGGTADWYGGNGLNIRRGNVYISSSSYGNNGGRVVVGTGEVLPAQRFTLEGGIYSFSSMNQSRDTMEDSFLVENAAQFIWHPKSA